MEDLSKYNSDGSNLRRAQLVMLNILHEVSKICNRNNIQYWIAFGTLLGAVRHKGFIPWDDDLDIEILHKDLKKLIECLELELPDSMKLQYEGNDKDYFHKYIKVRDRNSIMHELGSESFKERGIFIDIFPREYSTWILKTALGKVLGNSLMYSKSYLYKNKRKSLLQRVILQIRIVLYKWLLVFNRILSKVFPFNKLYSTLHGKGVEINIIFPLKEIVFEGHSFKCPANVDEYLKLYYGDYMKLPEPKNRIVHAAKIEFNED